MRFERLDDSLARVSHLCSEAGKTVRQFLCRWGGLANMLITENGPPLVAAIAYFARNVGIHRSTTYRNMVLQDALDT